MHTQYFPVDPEYFDFIEQSASKKEVVSVHYFAAANTVKNAKGKLHQILSTDGSEEYIQFKDGQKIRLDRIIALNGKPGPAYDEYDRFALACLDCMGGMD